jgi:heme iron utilization protein
MGFLRRTLKLRQGCISGDILRKTNVKAPPDTPPRDIARRLVRTALKGSLGTLDKRTGHPYASLVTLATEPDGAPVMLISRLALHTQNLAADTRASLLIDGTGVTGDPLAGGRVTLIGRVEPTTSPTARGRFLARHPEAEGYAGFADFAFHALKVEGAHFIGGFGRIVDLKPEDLLIDVRGAEALIAAEGDIVGHMNEDHAGALELYATELCSAAGGPWRMTGIDPEGCDMVCDGATARVAFAARINSPGEARGELVRLAGQSRESSPKP